MKGFGLPRDGLFLSDLPLSHGSRAVEGIGIDSRTPRRRSPHRAGTWKVASMTPMNEKESAISAHGSPFGCPTTRSKLFGARQCNLLIVINEFFERQSFDELAAHVRLFDPSVNAVVLRDEASMDVSLPPNPTLIFSPAYILAEKTQELAC